MIKYYTYYNYGGYKDLYLGCQQDLEDYRYFLPLLSVHEQLLLTEPDEDKQIIVERQKKLPKVTVLSDATVTYNYPSAARILMSHAGYKMLYRKLNATTWGLVLRDIMGPKDSYGRQTPYNMMFIGEHPEDQKSLDVLAEYIRCNMPSFMDFLNTIFENDLVENGLKVYMQKLNNEVERIITTASPLVIEESFIHSVRLAILPSDSNLSDLLREQNISKHDIALCYGITGNIIYKAAQQRYSQPTSPYATTYPQNRKSAPSKEDYGLLSSFLDRPKREEIQELWDYIHKLENRIINLENNK